MPSQDKQRRKMEQRRIYRVLTRGQSCRLKDTELNHWLHLHRQPDQLGNDRNQYRELILWLSEFDMNRGGI